MFGGLNGFKPFEDSTTSGELEELRRELAEAREQRSATTEIVRVISSSRHQEPLSEGPAIPAM